MIRKLGLVAVVTTLASLTVLCGVSPLCAQEAPRARVLINRPVDGTRLIPLAGNTRHEANANSDRGQVADDFPMEHMLLLLNRPPELEQEFEQYIESLTDKSSPNFHHWLMPGEQGQTYGLAQEDVDTVTGWLEAHGFTVGYVYPNRRVIDFSGTAGQIRKAFHTEIHHLDVRGKKHFANMSDPQIPEALAPAVLSVVSMHDFKPQTYVQPRTQYQVNGPGGSNEVVPADLQTIYNLVPVYRQGFYGQGQTIVVVEDAMPWSTDPTMYQTTFGLTQYGGSWTNIHPNAGNNCTAPASPNPDEVEATIDVDAVLAIAPGAAVEVASCNDGASDSTFGGLLALENLVSAGSPPAVISMSYGDCEASSTQGGNAAFYSAFQSAAAAGVSVFVSSGDQLSTSCSAGYLYGYFGIGVTGWGSTPYNVAVGGTDFEDTYNSSKAGIPTSTYWNSINSAIDGNAKSYIPEIPWNDSCASWLFSNYYGFTNTYGSSGFCNSSTATTSDAYLSISGGGGGPSGCANGASTDGYVSAGCAGYAKPSWQAGIFGNPADGVRDLPDVSLFASNGAWGHFFVICWSDTANYASSGAAACTNPPNPLGSPTTWSGFGGTSFSAPLMAGMQALVNQKWSMKSGNPNPIYYQIAKAEFGSSGDSACYSINQPPRPGFAASCVFNDITQGDIDVNCLQNGSDKPCYLPSGTNGVLSAERVSSVSVIQGGSGYTSAPTCTLGAPATAADYLSPTGGSIYAGGTQAGTCTATVSAGKVSSIAFSASGEGYAGGSGCTLAGGGGSGATCAAEVSVTTRPTTYEPAFYATPGWDFATGIGSVNAYNLVFNSAW
jgi:subtilase family serine protease